MKEINPAHLASVIRLINKGPFFEHLSITVTELGPGYSRVETVIDKAHLNPFGGVHGGVYASALDTAAYWSAYCDLPEESGLVTIDMNISLLGPILGHKVFIQGKRIKAGRTVFLTEAELTDSQGKLLAHGTSKLITTQNQQTISDAAAYLSAEQLPPKFLGEKMAYKIVGISGSPIKDGNTDALLTSIRIQDMARYQRNLSGFRLQSFSFISGAKSVV